MQTELADFVRDTEQGRMAEAILRKCVHCGFCTATCPTYQLLGDELDGPRGRIYLMKSMLEGEPVSRSTQLHLDRCLTCRNCETTCPSGVEYGHLVDIGRAIVDAQVERPWHERVLRATIGAVFTRPWLFGPLMHAGMAMRPLLPIRLAQKLPMRIPRAPVRPTGTHARRMVALAGCVQSTLTPDTNAATARVLDRFGITLLEAPGCCGALRFHLDRQDEGLDDMRRMIDRLWPHVEQGVEAFVMTASGCGATVREYGHHLRGDPQYADKAQRISAMTRDLTEVLTDEAARAAPVLREAPLVAFHAPCSLQHWQKLHGVGERLLTALGYRLTPVPDAHLCCGSAGAYSLLQPELSQQLKRNKLAALSSGMPEVILTANVGCQNHLTTEDGIPVKHWIVDLDERLSVR
ncbi:MAG TPA: glycolate oxidase subunit GlcF [Burkholderiales bacterium]|nr:glycolate oxidase subunit GlcF [Burkholderiales bacterium]